MSGEALNGEAMDAEIVPTAPAALVELGSLRGQNAMQLVQSASALASTLAQIINDRGLYKSIQGRDYVMCEGWTTLATLCGLMPREVACERDPETGAYVAVVALVRISDGKEMTRASAECGGQGDETWQQRAAFARRSMSITRATGKVCRIALSWIMNLAGFAPTPLEEMEQAEREIAARQLEAARRPPVPEKPLPKRTKKDLPPVSPEMQQDRVIDAQPSEDASGDPPWFDEKLGVGKHADKTWREMADGGLGGGRHRWLEWATKQATNDEREDEIKGRAKLVLAKFYTSREVQAKVF
ncbi:MAG TPA: hypothetical protein VFT98_00460 [Myxococcota bacterium]|nr:hypothetical protein [Myxococcota bacterium]